MSGVKVAQWRDSSLGTDMELENRVGGDKGKGSSGSPERPKLPIRQVGADAFARRIWPALVTKRGYTRVASNSEVDGPFTSWSIWSTGNRRNRLVVAEAAVLNECQEPCEWKQSSTVL